MCAAAHQRGWRAVVMNFRGCNGLELTSPKAREPDNFALIRTQAVRTRCVQHTNTQGPWGSSLASTGTDLSVYAGVR